MSSVVKLISGGTQLTLEACNGRRTIAGAKPPFNYVDPDFKNWAPM